MIKRFLTSLTAVLLLAVAAVPLLGATASAHGSHGSTVSGKYVALGDSVAAGLGLPPTSGDQPALCGRSTGSYAQQVAAAKDLDLTHIACSGATAGDLFTSQELNDGTKVQPQLKSAFTGGKPELVTVTAGANDLHWAELFAKCYTTTCGTSSDDTITNARRLALRVKLYYALFDIRVRSHGTPPKVVLTGYYNPLSANCAVLDPAHFTAEEMAWTGQQVQKLNQTIQEVSSMFSFASFAPVDFTGHDICSASPWVQGQTDPAPFHPNAAGQNAFGQAVLSKL